MVKKWEANFSEVCTEIHNIVLRLKNYISNEHVLDFVADS